MNTNINKTYGWICPLCGRALAPWMSACPCHITWNWQYHHVPYYYEGPTCTSTTTTTANTYTTSNKSE